MFTRFIATIAVLTSAAAGGSAIRASTISFSGYQWDVRDFPGGPGPNNWNPQNVFVDNSGDLHLQINDRNGQWSCAEVSLAQSLGFGTYQFQLIGRTDQLDSKVVLGLFTYGGPDGTNEIDIEDGQFGNTAANRGNYTVYPAQFIANYVNATTSFPISLNGTYTTQRFIWASDQIAFQSLYGHYNDDINDFAHWTFQPNDPSVFIPQNPAPVHMNLWLVGGQPPTDGMPVDIVVSSFTFTPVPEPSGVVLLGIGVLGVISYGANRRHGDFVKRCKRQTGVCRAQGGSNRNNAVCGRLPGCLAPASGCFQCPRKESNLVFDLRRVACKSITLRGHIE